jgi:hydroxymethylpyrimidine pyrophosphatase-like HAD family hydrolase
MCVRAVVADLDGTLVRRDFSISEATIEALELLKESGIAVIVATARTPPGVEYLDSLARRVSFAVCCSGAIGWSPTEHLKLWQEMFDPATTRRVVELATGCGAGVASFDGEIWRMTPEYERLSPGQPHGPTRVAVDPAELAESPCCTMAIRHSSLDLSNIRDLLAGDARAAGSHVGGSTVLDVMPEGVDKGTGALRALLHLGVEPSRAISFGDMPNDLPLFAVTGRSYAVGESDSAVTGSADEILDGVESDGFGKKIAELARAGWLVGGNA